MSDRLFLYSESTALVRASNNAERRSSHPHEPRIECTLTETSQVLAAHRPYRDWRSQADLA